MESTLIKSPREYRRKYGITVERLASFKEKAILLHPGPMNQDIEIDGAAAASKHSLILKQVENGVFARMAVLSKLLS
jgi:aspartate carbamoyltransferase catalytic subunit